MFTYINYERQVPELCLKLLKIDYQEYITFKWNIVEAYDKLDTAIPQ